MECPLSHASHERDGCSTGGSRRQSCASAASGLPADSPGRQSGTPSSSAAVSPSAPPDHIAQRAQHAQQLAAAAADMLAEAKAEIEAEAPMSVPCTPRGVVELSGPLAATAKAGAVSLKDFELMRLVGQGAFGKVFQVRHKKSKDVFAMKVMRKDTIHKQEHAGYIKSERDVLTAVTHPYIVALRFSFQTPSKLYLVLDFCNGGHLFYNLYCEGLFSEAVSRLYTAEIVSAISYLHSKNIMHRDLKPENVLLDAEGHIRLTDFGLAKEYSNEEGGAVDRTNSFIGTMEYMAPEIIEGNGHDMRVDWWSTGVLLYEMLTGMPPFRNISRSALQREITTGKIKYPKFLSSPALSLLKGLFTRDPAKRLGCGPNGPDEIKRHPFFKAVNWAKLERREIPSSFKPKVDSWTDAPVEDSPCCTPASHVTRMFVGFTYEHPSLMRGGAPSPGADGQLKTVYGGF
ncbi:hypothetical protein FOA52_012244 [Chlamydomonas sp. UWO 241]|nr:hypothetical protein FOA52_012244 [Chlamydomonas sp. UWO 241]